MINQQIRERCEVAGLKQIDVARICDVTQATVSNWWHDKYPIPLNKALLLRDALNMTLDEMCGEKYADKRLQVIADIFALLGEEGRDYMVQQARFAYQEYR